MKKRSLVISFFTLIILLIIQSNVFASAVLTLSTSIDKPTYLIGDTIVVTVDWNIGMQAASFTLNYDKTQLKFKSADIPDTFYIADVEGIIEVNWASMEEIDFTKMNFNFEAISDGTSTVSITQAHSFADDNLHSPSSYDVTSAGSTQVIINKSTLPKEEEDDEKQEPNPDDSITNEKLPNTGMMFVPISLISSLPLVGIITFIKYKNLSDI